MQTIYTKEQAIRECKELWRDVAKSELSKDDFLDTPEGQGWKLKYHRNFDCPLCAFVGMDGTSGYVNRDGNKYPDVCVNNCPFFLQYGKGCYELGFDDDNPPSFEWLEAIMGLKE